MIRFRWLCLVCVAALIGCMKNSKELPGKSSHRQADHADEPAHKSLPRKFRLDPTVVKDARIRTATVEREALVDTLALLGEISAVPDKIARIASPVAGRISHVFVNEGDTVRKGAPLVVVRVPDLGNIQSAYTSAAAKAQAARVNADRLQALVQKGLAAQQEVASAEAEAKSMEAAAAASKKQLNTLGISANSVSSDLTLRAPLSGVVITREAVVGQPVVVDASVATVADLSLVWFLGRVFEKDLARLRTGSTAEVELNAYPSEHFSGTVTYLGKQIDPVARTVVARIPLHNRNDVLRVGLFGTARISTQETTTSQKPALIVPRQAVTEIGSKSVVFVQHRDGDYELHEIVLGASALGKVQVLSGLREGERVVIDGVFTLKSLVLKTTFAEDE